VRQHIDVAVNASISTPVFPWFETIVITSIPLSVIFRSIVTDDNAIG
jgi:hypothetical protein